MVTRSLAGALALVILARGAVCAQFPRWTVAHAGLSGVWEGAAIIATGRLDDVHPIGAAPPGKLPPMASPTIKRIYWCEGRFTAHEAIRGKMPPPGAPYRWGTIRPGCALDREKPTFPGDPLTVVWFIREEGAYLRPVVDGGGPFFFTIHRKWAPEGLSPERHFGQLLLSPDATGMTQEEYAGAFIKPASLACYILGRPECITRIRALAANGNQSLRDAACTFLKRQFDQACAQ